MPRRPWLLWVLWLPACCRCADRGERTPITGCEVGAESKVRAHMADQSFVHPAHAPRQRAALLQPEQQRASQFRSREPRLAAARACSLPPSAGAACCHDSLSQCSRFARPIEGRRTARVVGRSTTARALNQRRWAPAQGERSGRRRCSMIGAPRGRVASPRRCRRRLPPTRGSFPHPAAGPDGSSPRPAAGAGGGSGGVRSW